MSDLRQNLVVIPDGHILHRTALEVQLRRPWMTMSERADPDKTNIYFPYYLMEEKTRWDVAIFTHKEGYDLLAKRVKFEDVAQRCDVPIAMSKKTASKIGRDCMVLEIPANPQFETKKRITVLVPSINYGPNSRKCHEILDRLDAPGIDLIWTAGAAAYEEMPMWYNKADYVLVVGKNEGGPMAVKEAIAMGKPVIAPDVGWAWDHPVIRYRDEHELNEILNRLAPKPHAWDYYVRGLDRACRGVTDGIHGQRPPVS